MRKKRVYYRQFLAMVLALLFVFAGIAEVFPAYGAEKITNPDRRGAGIIDGIDTNPTVGRQNSYAWAGELFRQTDGDYLWVGISRNHGTNLVMDTTDVLDMELALRLLPMTNLPVPTLDMAARIYRQRASDPHAPWELVFVDPTLSGFRRMIEFNGYMYVLGGFTNTQVVNYSSILRFSPDFRPGDTPEVIKWATLFGRTRDHFRSVTILDNRMYVGNFGTRIYSTDGSGLQNLTPNSGDGKVGWDFAFCVLDFGLTQYDGTWDMITFNDSIYMFMGSTRQQLDLDYTRGFRVVRVTPGEHGYTHEHIVGGSYAKYPFGMGIPGNATASPFLSTSFEQEYVYVTTFANSPQMLRAGLRGGDLGHTLRNIFTPAQVYRFDRYGNWEVVVGDTTGERVAVDHQGNPIPHVGNQRAGFSLEPDDRHNTSSNQYTWWMSEHEGRLYVGTFNMTSFHPMYGLANVLSIGGFIEGSLHTLVDHLEPTLNDIHNMFARYSRQIDFESLAIAVDAHLLAAEAIETVTYAQQRAVVEGLVDIVAMHLPTEQFRTEIRALTDVIMDVIGQVGIGNHEKYTTREIAVRMVEDLAISSEIFGGIQHAGFYLYVSEDGKNFEPITVNGFGDPYNYGARVMISSEHGLHVYTVNPFFGGQIWRADQPRLNLHPNGPTRLTIGRGATKSMTVLVTDAETAVGNISVSHDSELVEVHLMRRPAHEISFFSWDHEVEFDPIRDCYRFVITENETRHQSVLYEVSFMALRPGQETVTLDFELDGITASRTIDLTVQFAGVVDRIALGEKLDGVNTLNRSNFTVISWVPFLMAYADGLATYFNPSATQTQVNRALHTLIAAYNNLVPNEPPPGYSVITTENQLRAISRRGNYWLANDIALTGPWSPIANFQGSFIGNGRTISNLVVNNPRTNNQGMFRQLSQGATVMDLKIQVGADGVRGFNRVGALAGSADRAAIIGVRVQVGHDGVVGNREVGGLVGWTRGAQIVGSFVYGNNGMTELYMRHPEPDSVIAIRGNRLAGSSTGGLAGTLDRTIVAYSASYVNVTGYVDVGGFVGNLENGLINDSFARGLVLGRTTYSRGRHSRGESIGGFIGVSSSGPIIENVYSTGVVLSYGNRWINPFVGRVRGSLRARGINFYDRDVSRNSTVSTQNMTGIQAMNPVGLLRGSLIGESTRNLRTQTTFTQLGANWDFETIWTVKMLQGTPLQMSTYPHFIAGIALASTPPVISLSTHTDTRISGIGNSEDAIIRVELPDGTELETVTGRDLQWYVDIPPGVTLGENDEIRVTQQEAGLPESEESIIHIQIDRPISLCGGIELENITTEYSDRHLVGDTVRLRVEITNSGEDSQRAEHIQLINTLPHGITFVPGSVRLISENDNGDEVRSNIPRNTSGISSSGHSFNAVSRNLEVRLGNLRLYGTETRAVEFDVVIGPGAIPGVISSVITAGRVSKASPDNIISIVVSERITVE